MSADFINKAAQVLAPVEGTVFGQATSAVAARYEIPADWAGSWVTVTAITEDLEIVFGDSAVTVAFEQNNTVTSEAITLADNVGDRVFAGTKDDYYIPERYHDAAGDGTSMKPVTHFAVIAAAAGRVQVRRSSKKTGGA